MSTDLDAAFSEQFMNISTKLKKRFMRKPNISEATNEFVGLAIQAEHCEQPSFAAHAFIGAAKCEASIGNFLGEAEQYLNAARQFMQAEKKLRSLKFHSPDRENLEAAIGCFMLALSKYPEKSTLRTSIYMEVANALQSLNLKCEAVHYYELALSTIEDRNMKLMCLQTLLNLQIDCEKYDQAFDTANNLSDSNLNPPENIKSEVAVSRVLLSLYVEPSEEKKPDSLKKLLTNVMDDEDDEFLLNTDLKLKLQSIVLCCSTDDLQTLVQVCADGMHLFTMQQKELVESLIRKKRLEHLSLR